MSELSEKERRRRGAQSAGSHVETTTRLLYSREQVAGMLGGVSIATVRRLEREGRLKPVRLSRSPTAMVFFRAADVEVMIEEAGAESAART